MVNNTNNTNNTNNASYSGVFGNAGRGIDPGSDWIFQDRMNFPLVDDPGMDGRAFQNWNYLGGSYPDRDWSPIWFAWRTLCEYVQLLSWGQPDPWEKLDPGDPQPDKDEQDELDKLADYARFERADALAEILAQKDEFISEFMGLLVITPSSHPNTYRIMHVANLFAAFTVMHFKTQYKRLRPSQLLPRLRPPTQVPGHASYPSGHSTQAHLIAHCVTAVLPSAMVSNGLPSLKFDIFGLADRIARNRELAGLHYPSDTEGGKKLASKIFDMIQADKVKPEPRENGQQVMPSYAMAFQSAQDEWTNVSAAVGCRG